MFARLAAPSVKLDLCDGEERIPLGYSARLLADFLETLIGKSPFEIDLGLTADADSDVLPRRGLPSSNHLTLISDKPHGTRLSRSTKLDVKNIEFCGIHHHIQDEDVNWGASYERHRICTGIKRVKNPSLISPCEPRARKNDIHGRKPKPRRAVKEFIRNFLVWAPSIVSPQAYAPH
ncbi:hypothetical protein PSHT_11961 [Puccinia striiformis]|uniref:Uncharacterized protein n=2 Tax=Puccinia striiformis TaxID=27350 RepID=A0A2S4W3E0_9BASI|nr:hypothetical protein PSHT_11961 [Puccinia striiformis]POW16291.1 hypothetical protein PSTT_01492 [Puccinia striiformis]